MSRHLYIVPKSDPVAPGYIPPNSADSLQRELKSFLRKKSSPLPDELIASLPSLVSHCGPRELVLLTQFLTVRTVNDPNINLNLFQRTTELASNMTLSQLLVFSSFLGRKEELVSAICRKANIESVKYLNSSELISLLTIAGVDQRVPVSELSRRLKQLTDYDLATVLNAIRDTKDSACVRFLELASGDCIRRLTGGAATKPRDVALIANAFAGQPLSLTTRVFSVISDQTVLDVGSWNLQSLAMLTHAIAKSGVDDVRVLDMAASAVSRRILEFRAQQKPLGMLMYSFGKRGIRNDEMLKSVAELVKRDIQTLEWQTMAAVVYGFSKLRFVSDKQLWTILGEEVVFRGTEKRNARRFKNIAARDVAMLAKGFSRIESVDKTQVAHVLSQLLKRVEVDKSSAVEVLESFARFDDSNVAGKVNAWTRQHIGGLLDTMTSFELLSVTSSLVKLKIKSTWMNEKILEKVENIGDCNLRILFLRKIAKLDFEPPFAFVRNTCKLISANLGSLDPQQLVDVLHAVSELNYRDETFTSRMIQALCHHLKRGSVESHLLATVVVAAARLRVQDEPFYEVLVKCLFEESKIIVTERAVCNTAFSLATAFGSGDWKDEAGWFPSVVTRIVGNAPAKLSVEGIRQLQVLGMTLRMKNVQLDDQKVNQLLARVQSVYTFKTNNPSIEQSSATHRDVSRYLNKLGLVHRNETTIGPYSLDIFVPDQKVVIEVDGPHHFFRETNVRTSSSVLKHLILQSQGFTVMHVPYQEWQQCTSDLKKMAYCSHLVANVRAPSFIHA